MTKKKKLTLMNVFWHYWRAYVRESAWKLWTLIWLRSLLVFVALGMPFVVAQIVDLATQWALWHDMIAYVWYLVWLYIVSIGGWRMYGFVIMQYQLNITNTLLTSATKKLMHHSMQFFTSTPLGKISKDIDKYAWWSESWFDILMFEFLPMVLGIVIVVAMIFTFSPLLASMVIVFLWVYIWLQIKAYAYKQWYEEKASKGLSTYFGRLSDSFTNIFSVIYHGSYQQEQKKLSHDSETMMTKFLASWRIGELISVGNSLAINLLEWWVFFFVLWLWSQWEITIGAVVLMYTYLFRLTGNIMFLSNVIKRFVKTLTDAKDMLTLMQQKPDIQDSIDAHDIDITAGQIVFENVSFGYKDKHIIKDFDLTVSSGQKIGVVWHSWAWKSTLIKLLMRLYDINQGRISIDGQDIAAVTQASLRQQISFVPQEPLLFHRSLRDNITYGAWDVSEQQIHDALKHAHCYDFVMWLDDGLETLVGERWVKLSGWERQRVVIARAILQNNPLLVLDEATSALDSQSEKYIQDALEYVMQNKTTLVIAHRLSTLTRMDRIIVMDGWYIVQDGSHADLITQEGLYQELWSLQSGGFMWE